MRDICCSYNCGNLLCQLNKNRFENKGINNFTVMDKCEFFIPIRKEVEDYEK